jgi:thiol-disulfide isomerase/thioredoxin
MADKGKKNAQDGFQREVPEARINIDGPGRDHAPEKPGGLPPPPGATPGEQPPASATPAPPSGSAQAEAPAGRTVVPSCVRVGNRVENFTLYDVKGNVFELAKDRKGKLVLLDIWFTGCGPCRRAIPKLNALQNKYGRYGLEVIGIAYEQGTLAEKQQSLEDARRRYRLSFDYRMLFGGGGGRSCPVAEQLEVHAYPTVVLLDEEGRIVWRSQGMDEHAAYQMEMAIYQKLFPRRLAER